MNQPNSTERLDSWKEIATFLRRDVRTVQRWEKKEALPVHRHQHEKLGSVYAYPAELNAWFAARQPSSPSADAQQGRGDKIKLAVLPFVNLGDSREDEYFTDGLTDEMITEVTRLQPEQLAVIARTTALHYDSSSKSLEQMKKDLGVDYVLEGRVRRGGSRVRITVQLSEVQDQTQLWAETYERDLSDMLSVQAEIARAIAGEIHLALNLPESKRLEELQKGQRRVRPEAYDAYLQARYHLHEMSAAGISRSIEDFQRAVHADSSYAPAHAGLASAYALLAIAPFDLMPPREVMPKAEAEARKALELDGSLAEAHAALALVEHHYHWNWKAAEESYRRAIELNPDYAAAHLWYSWLLLALGKNGPAMEEIERTMRIVQETDPHRLIAVHATRAQAYYFQREFERGARECEKGLELDSAHFMLRYILGRCYMRMGKNEKAIEQFQAAADERGEIPLVDAALGLAYAVNGRQEETQKVAESLRITLGKRYVPPTYFGMLYAGVGDRERAIRWLEKAFKERADGLTWLAVEPMMDDLRSDPRMQDLIERIGLEA
ncbi:MAG TPA: tetratricopeptide repeat protein [Candidatus Limnocylindrales bacterium]|nr:tetratricopeptide repeat protein [Candidatus Limnocylindrales bacterium]